MPKDQVRPRKVLVAKLDRQAEASTTSRDKQSSLRTHNFFKLGFALINILRVGTLKGGSQKRSTEVRGNQREGTGRRHTGGGY